MTTKIYIKDKGYLDIYEDINIPVNYSLADVSDISKRNSSFSKTIILPGSKNNNQILGNIFDVNINFLDCDFAINRKIEATIFQNDIPVLVGYFKLLRVNKISPSDISFEENIEYEAVVYSNQAGIFDVIKDLNVNQVDLSEGNHILSFDAINNSSTNTWVDGWKYIWHYTQHDKYKVSDFRPSFFAKKLFDKIFQNAGYTYTSNFLNSEPFTKLLIPTNVKDLLISDEEVEDRSCRASFSIGFSQYAVNRWFRTSQSFTANNLTYNRPENIVFQAPQANYNATVQLKFNDDTTGLNFDGAYDNFNTTTHLFTAPKTGAYEIELNLAGTMTLTCPEDTFINIPLGTPVAQPRGYFDIGFPAFDIFVGFIKINPNLTLAQGQLTALNSALFTYDIPTIPKVYNGINYRGLNSGDTIYNYSFKPEKFIVNLNVGEQIKIVYKAVTYATQTSRMSNGQYFPLDYEFFINGYQDTNSYLKVKAVKNNLSSGDEVFLNEIIPKNIKQSDFIKSFINLFNLYIIPDEENEKNLIIKTRDEFYSDFQDDVIDWTDKLDYNQEYNLTLLSELQEKTLNFTYKSANDEVSKRYREQTGYDYGQFILNFDNDFLTGEKKIEPIFENTPLVKTLLPLGDEGATFIVPYLVYGVETKPKLLYDGGNISVTDYVIQDVDSNGVVINNNINYYGYAGHFDNPVNPTFDLNWNVNEVYFYNEVLSNVTLNNLFNLYWFNYVELISQSKLLTAYFRLDELDVSNLNFAKPIWIRDSYWLLNKIVDYNASENGLTKCELIKSINSPKYNESYTVIPPYLSDVQVSNPIRSVKGTPFIQNVAMGNFENENWGYSSLLYGQDNNIMSNVKNSEIQGNINLIGTSAENVTIKGNFNFVGGNAKNVYIQGSENSISAGCINISLVNCNNVKILDGISNVSISNLTNQIIDRSNITFTNTYNFFEQGYQIKAADIIDGGENIVIEPLSQQEYPIDLVDGLENAVYNLDESTDLVNGIINGTRINFQEDII